MDRSRRAGIGQWHEYDHVACNNLELILGVSKVFGVLSRMVKV